MTLSNEERLEAYRKQKARFDEQARKCRLSMLMSPNRAVVRLYAFMEKMEAEGRMTDEKFEKMDSWMNRMEKRIMQDDIEEFM